MATIKTEYHCSKDIAFIVATDNHKNNVIVPYTHGINNGQAHDAAVKALLDEYYPNGDLSVIRGEDFKGMGYIYILMSGVPNIIKL